MQATPKQRIFLVGCPRSGTTLLQSLLAAHPDITSFPESHFFRYLIGSGGRLRRTLGIASPKARSRFEEFLSEINHNEMQQYLSKFAFSTHQYIHAFVKTLDTLAQQQGKSYWLEKTPDNLHYINYIEKSLPKAKFIHIVRNGIDVISSLFEVSHKYPEWGHTPDIDRCIERWINDVNLTLTHISNPNHILVRYESLIEDKESIIKNLCNFIGVVFTQATFETIIQNYGVLAEKVTLKNEPWKASVQTKIQNKNNQKFYKLFDESQRCYIMNRLSELKINDINMKLTQVENEKIQNI